MGGGDWRPEAPLGETALTSIVDCSRNRSSIAAGTSVVPRLPERGQQDGHQLEQDQVPDDVQGRSLCQASPLITSKGVRPRVQETENGYEDTSKEGNETGALEATRSGEHAVEISHVHGVPCTRTQFTLHSYPFHLVPRPTRSNPRPHARTQQIQ